MKRLTLLFLVCISITMLSGCLYPQEKLAENQIPYEDQIQSVQTAVDKFQKDNGGILPIKTRDQSTPIYEKYPIDYKKIVPQYLSDSPGNSYENGGIFQYVLIDVETNPTVKIFDLRIAEKIRELHMRINAQGYPPYKNEVSKNVYTLNYKKIGYKEEPFVVSPYSNNNLPFVITGQGDIFVDYSSDLYHVLRNKNVKVKPGEDIRHILTDDSLFVPAYSLPYTINQKNEPIFLAK
ncbi:hypothetical protein [Heyndrickxia oleronia]|uniref:hypothetical protein n=1 Tax=Heyndrickxia oleronia TaxID=38875 RepID=UPI00242CCC90|nr:hypothetical protein [Heyndrickxia oleronia]MCI1592069.1 hypothetical protein [Heyndrickxia oleronia]MCI1612277.1 hypothetical protein [Heyndrickxia oleronia]MCI1745349.1 hypothetical protein [Heyndrickxia oleronia]MCI1761984.1 hypothetical protein [Heyndrickxia oleronia]